MTVFLSDKRLFLIMEVKANKSQSPVSFMILYIINLKGPQYPTDMMDRASYYYKRCGDSN